MGMTETILASIICMLLGMYFGKVSTLKLFENYTSNLLDITNKLSKVTNRITTIVIKQQHSEKEFEELKKLNYKEHMEIYDRLREVEKILGVLSE